MTCGLERREKLTFDLTVACPVCGVKRVQLGKVFVWHRGRVFVWLVVRGWRWWQLSSESNTHMSRLTVSQGFLLASTIVCFQKYTNSREEHVNGLTFQRLGMRYLTQ